MILNIFKRALSLTEKNEKSPGPEDTSNCDEAADVELKETIYGKR